jgi:hypothetical protein
MAGTLGLEALMSVAGKMPFKALILFTFGSDHGYLSHRFTPVESPG